MQCFHCLFEVILAGIHLGHCNSGNLKIRRNLLYFIQKFEHICKAKHPPRARFYWDDHLVRSAQNVHDPTAKCRRCIDQDVIINF